MKRLLLGLAVVAIAIMLLPAKTITIEPPVSQPDIRGKEIDAYYHAKSMPMEGYGGLLVAAADRNGLDWRLEAALSVRESSGGLQSCGANVFGWDSCQSTFRSIPEAINIVAANLGGNVSSTRAFYAGKTTIEKIHAYNPETIVPGYAASVVEIMGGISPSLHPSSTVL